MERKKVLGLKENQVLQKKIIQNHLALQIILNISEENLQKIHLQTQRKKSFGFKGKKKFKSRNSRPKSFSFKKHSKKRVKS